MLPAWIAYGGAFSANTAVISTAKVWLAGTEMPACQAIVQLLDVHVVEEPAGFVAPSMNTAARVVPGETYSTSRELPFALVAGGILTVMDPWAVAAVCAPEGAPAMLLMTAELLLEPSPEQAYKLAARTKLIPISGTSARRFIGVFEE